ncbi:MAG: hypothetical protein M3Y87_04185 [Myxococcota bacterium]|nr:hypothetical protein [Myxococcota bacterium]
MTVDASRTFTLQTGGLELRTLAAAPLESQARGVLQAVAALRDTPRGVAPGITIDFGGALFVIADEGGALHVCEPDYGGPGHGALSADISRSLITIVRQLALLRAIELAPVPCSFRQTFTAPRALDWSGKIYLQRDAAPSPEDSGWFIGSAEPDAAPTPDDPAAYEKHPLHALFGLRPAAMTALLLPVGYMAIVDGDRVVGVADGDDQEVWSADAAPGVSGG